ncbi:MAG: glycine-rich protein, partial [Oscillibacter sp.]|nr:glycine-rich protein [Oscillibacter sp.]
NTNNGVNRLSSLSDLNFRGDEREQALSYLKNVNSGTSNSINGPVRCGLFATSATNQTQAGATYWGVMEMSGNLKELCVSVGNPNFNGGSCGTGMYNTTYWNTAVGSYGVRGGGFSSPDSLLRTSDRTEAMNYFTTITQRDSTVGFRGVYNLSGIKIAGGEIKMSQDTACWGETDVLNVVAASCPDFPDVRFQYNWYVKKPGEAKFDIIANAAGESLTYEHFENKTASPVVYTFKRTGICAMGVAESNQVTVIVLPEPFVASSYTFDPCPVAISHRWTGLQKEWRIIEDPDAFIVEDGTDLLVSNLTANGVYTLEAQIKGCPDVFTAQINVTNMETLTSARTYGYTGAAQCVVLPAGKYQIEAWGASGGTYNGSIRAGYGGYTSGVLTLSQAQSLVIFVGSVPIGATNNGGFNGGGRGDTRWGGSGGGGGASDIRLVNAAWNNFESLKSRIMVAAGGGGSSNYGTNGGYYGYGGHGGGLIGGNGSFSKCCSGGSFPAVATGGTQTSGGIGLGRGCDGVGAAGSGGGYYGGNKATYGYNPVGSGAGGSSFISGHTGCDAINSSGSHTGQAIHYSGLFFTNTSMTAGANSGHGQVRITPVN